MSASTRPHSSSALWMIAAPPSAVATVSKLTTASPPRPQISSTTSSAGLRAGGSPMPSVSEIATPTSFTTTLAPRAASSSAYSRPRLRPAPVTTTTRSSKRRPVTIRAAPLFPGGHRAERPGRHAAVDQQLGAGAVRRGVGGEPADELGDVLGGAHSAGGHRIGEARPGVATAVGVRREHGSVDRARVHRVHSDVVAGELERRDLGEPAHGELARRVRSRPGRALEAVY